MLWFQLSTIPSSEGRLLTLFLIVANILVAKCDIFPWLLFIGTGLDLFAQLHNSHEDVHCKVHWSATTSISSEVLSCDSSLLETDSVKSMEDLNSAEPAKYTE